MPTSRMPTTTSACSARLFADELTLDSARAALAGEKLGQRGVTDLLSISLSAHDYISHGNGPESQLTQDHLLHLDTMLGRFFRDLDKQLGRQRYTVVLTADHGSLTPPGPARSDGMPGACVTT